MNLLCLILGHKWEWHNTFISTPDHEFPEGDDDQIICTRCGEERK
jgi:hypothetical protein